MTGLNASLPLTHPTALPRVLSRVGYDLLEPPVSSAHKNLDVLFPNAEAFEGTVGSLNPQNDILGTNCCPSGMDYILIDNKYGRTDTSAAKIWSLWPPFSPTLYLLAVLFWVRLLVRVRESCFASPVPVVSFVSDVVSSLDVSGLDGVFGHFVDEDSRLPGRVLPGASLGNSSAPEQGGSPSTILATNNLHRGLPVALNSDVPADILYSSSGAQMIP
ncbi:hypothetical protein Nepgr_006633 [Nepenthes gracilis]|uniref:Uncharacterized protein n=1 Tax=Nepenthes gracilis TaxID=150966 RepID=A0AAD3S5I6_NEPGR|nr:hypothetical protein Nepgr_006633 [Nepenthes gracilis]